MKSYCCFETTYLIIEAEHKKASGKARLLRFTIIGE
jgi:hypothetical protein